MRVAPTDMGTLLTALTYLSHNPVSSVIEPSFIVRRAIPVLLLGSLRPIVLSPCVNWDGTAARTRSLCPLMTTNATTGQLNPSTPRSTLFSFGAPADRKFLSVIELSRWTKLERPA